MKNSVPNKTLLGTYHLFLLIYYNKALTQMWIFEQIDVVWLKKNLIKYYISYPHMSVIENPRIRGYPFPLRFKSKKNKGVTKIQEKKKWNFISKK